MPTIQELYAALERADKAGDTASARQIASYIQSVGGVAQQPAQEPAAKQNVGTLGDIKTAIKQGVAGIPGSIAGLADIPLELATGKNYIAPAGEKLADLLDVHPSEYIQKLEQEKSPAYQKRQQEAAALWEARDRGEASLTDLAKFYASNPALTATNVAESAPSMLLGGAYGRALKGVGQLGAVARGAIGESAVTAGQINQQLGEDNEGSRRQAAAALLGGAGTGVIAGGSGKLAQKLGIIDPETFLAGRTAPLNDAELAAFERVANQGIAKRFGLGAVQEGVLQELPQSVLEQMAQNWGAGKPIMEGVERQAIEGTLAGGVVGGGFNVMAGNPARAQIQARDEAQRRAATEERARAERQATGVMDQQPLFTPEEAPVPAAPVAPVAEEAVVPEPTLTIPDAEPEQMALFGPRGGVRPEAVGTRAQPVPEPVAPEMPAAEGTLTPELLKQFDITPRFGKFYKALVGANLADPMTYQTLVQAAESGNVRGMRAVKLMEAFPQYNPQEPQQDLFGAPAYGQQRPETEPEQRDMFGVQADGLRAEVEPAGVERGVEQPVLRDTTEPATVGEPTGGGLGDVSQPAGGRIAPSETGQEVQPSALTPKELRAQERAAKAAVKTKELEAKAAAATLKKEPIATTWSYFSDIPYAKLSKETKRQVKEAHDQNYLTQEIADTIEGIERKNQRVAAENKLIKPETALDDDVQKPAKIKDLTVTQDYLEEELTRLEDIKNRLANPLPKNTVQAMIQDAVDKWENNARSGVHGRYNAGEIEATKEYMLDAPADYADSLNLPTEVTDALTVSSGRGIEGYRADDIDAAIEAVQSELANERRTRTRLQFGDYASVVESRVADGTIRTKDAPLFNAVLNNDLIGVYSWIEKNALNSNHRLLARLLRRANINPIIEFGETDTETALAHYDPTYDKVVVDVGNYLQESASAQGMASSILHEVMHSATVNKLGKAFFTINEMSKGWTPTQPVDRKYVASAEFKAAKNLFTTFDWLAKNHPDVFTNKKHYGATNPLELTAEIFVDPTLYKALNDIKLPAELTQAGSMNALTWVIKKIKQLLGIDAAPDSAVAAIMRDTLTLASPRKPYNKRIEATGVDIMGLNDLQKKYDSGNTIAYDPRAQAAAQQLITNMSGTLIQSSRAPTPTPSQVAQNVVQQAVQNPSGALRMIENAIDKVRTITADKGAFVAAQIQDFHDGAFYGVNGTIREDMLLSAEANTGNYIDAYFNFGGIDVLKNGAIQVTDSDYSVDNIYKAAKELANRIGVNTAKELITKSFYHYRAAAIKAMPQDMWPDNWKQDPRMVPTQQQIQASLDAFKQIPELEEMRKQFIGSKNNIVSFLNKAGFLTAEKTKEYLADDSYAPWMRIKEYQDKAPGMGNIGRMVDLSQMKKLVGGTEEVNDMLENMAQMLAWGVRSGIKNHTANSALNVMEQMGTAVKFKGRPGNADPAHIVMTYTDGKPTFWRVDNPHDLAAFQSVKGLDSGVMRQIAKWMGTLRAGIVLFPVFPIRQVIMDSQRAYMQSGVERPLAMVGKIFKAFLTGEAYKEISADAETLRKFGVAAQVDYNTYDATRGMAQKYGLKEREGGITNWWVNTSAYQTLHKFAYSADLAVRLGIYRQTMEETGDQTLAATRAREIINFQKSGTSSAMITLKQAIPFLGAYLQGMDVNYRSMTGRGNSMKQRKAAAAAYWSNVAMYAGLVVAYTMAMSGDDEYEEQKGFVTDRNFLIPGGGLLPVPPDAGFIPKVLTERITDYILQEGTDNPESAERLRQGIREAAFAAYLPPATVYGVTPIIELSTNKSFFSDMPIVGEFYKGLKPSEQYTPRTSEFAKLVGQAADMSPIQIDYVFNAIGGTTAGAMLQLADVMMGSEKTAPDKLPIVGTFQQKPVGGRYMEEYYATREMTSEAYNTIKAMVDRGEQEKAEQYATDPKIMARLNARDTIEQIHTHLNKASELKNAIDNDKTLTAEQRRMMVNELYKQVEAELKGLGIRQIRSQLE